MISFISSLKFLISHYQGQKFSYEFSYVVDAVAVNPHGIKTLLVYGLSTFFIKGNPVFSNDANVYLRSILFVLFYAIEFLIILC